MSPRDAVVAEPERVAAPPATAEVGELPSFDPRTGEVIATFDVHDTADVRAAVARAREGTVGWSGLSHRARRAELAQWRRLIVERLDELADLVSRETGKSMADAKLESILAIDHLHWAAKNAGRVLGRSMVAPGMLMSNHLATVEYEPLGVVGVIGPWNYPIFTPMGSIAYALAAGNTVVFKPSEETPAVGAWLASTFREAVGRPAVLQVVTGRGATGEALCRSGVSKIAFTGSPATARRVMAACADSLTPLVVEGGGKDALIVDRDADLDAAADAVVWGSMANSGQTCVGVERVYAEASIADDLIRRVASRAGGLSVGGDAGAQIGPITLASQVGIIREHIEEAIADGGTAVVGGVDAVRPPYVSPTVLVDVPETSAAVRQETFGPVVIINRVDSMAEAVRRANDTDYGLGATVFAKENAAAIVSALRAGMVGVNSILPYAGMPALPFGGSGESGFGRIHGADGLREFARPKSVARKLLPAVLTPTSFSRPRHTMSTLDRLARVLYGR